MPAPVRDLLRQTSHTEQQIGEPPSTELAMRRRAQDDLPRLQAALRSLGYYEAVVETDLVPPAEPAAGGKPGPYTVRFQVAPGPLYTFADLRLELTDNPAGFVPPPWPTSA